MSQINRSAAALISLLLLCMFTINVFAATSSSNFSNYQGGFVTYAGNFSTKSKTFNFNYTTSDSGNIIYDRYEDDYAAHNNTKIMDLNITSSTSSDDITLNITSGYIRLGYIFYVPDIPEGAKNISVVLPYYPQLIYKDSSGSNISFNTTKDSFSFVIKYWIDEEVIDLNENPLSIEYYSGYGLLVTFPINNYSLQDSYRLIFQVLLPVGTYQRTGVKLNAGAAELWFNTSINKKVIYTYDYDASQSIEDAINKFEEATKGGFDDVNSNLEGIQSTLDLIQAGQDVTNEKIEALTEVNRDTNEYLRNELKSDVKDGVSDALAEEAEREKDEATVAGEESISGAINAVSDVLPSEGFSKALSKLLGSVVYDGTACIIEFPALYIPSTSVNNRIELSQAHDINLSMYAVTWLPQILITLIGFIITGALCLASYNEILYWIDFAMNGGSKKDE